MEVELMENNIRTGKLPLKVKLGYGVGTVGDSIPYTLFFTYFVFFLTDYVGISAAKAGIISFVAVLSQALISPVIGYMSDNSHNPNGRRRPIMKASLVPYAVLLVLLFLPINVSGTGAFIYYLAVAIFMQIGYAVFCAPWDALGAELTQDYTERNNVRLFVGIAGYPACLIASSGTIGMVGVFGDNPRMGWFVGALICTVVVLLGGFTAIKSTKGYESIDPAAEVEKAKVNLTNLFRQYGSILKIKCYRWLTIMQFIFVLGYIILTNATVYMLTYNAGMNEGQQSIFWVANTVLCMVTLPIATAFANKFDKKFCVYFFLAVACVAYVVFFIIGVDGFTSALVFSFFLAFATTVFYGILYSLIYDCCQVHELATGKQSEGSIMALSRFVQTLASAVAGLLTGLLLTAIGYDPTNVTESTVHGILFICTIIPAILTLLSLFALYKDKMTPTRFQAVLKALEDRRAGKEVDLGEFKDII